MTEKQVVKILKIMQSGTDAEKETIRKLYPKIHGIYVPTVLDNAAAAIKYLLEMNERDGKIDLYSTVITAVHQDGVIYEFLTTARKQK